MLKNKRAQLPLLDSIQHMTGMRERPQIELTLAQALFSQTQAQQVNIYKLSDSADGAQIWVAVSVDAMGAQLCDDGISVPEDLLRLSNFPAFLAAQETGQVQRIDGTLAVPVLKTNGQCFGFVEIKGATDAAVSSKPVAALLAIFTNLLALLDYGEIDTLTGLLTRKTFDAYLDRILTSIYEGDSTQNTMLDKPLRRRLSKSESGHWLGVVDIDHFKKVNDNFGHSIGDEVLLLVANMMRSCFRAYDKLFRFGGEEFVVLLKPTTTEEAQGAFERFRRQVESRDFPMVGRVTVSTGFARIRPSDQPSIIFDRADRALYWVKSHGRNQTCSFEDLILSGALVEKNDKPDMEFY